MWMPSLQPLAEQLSIYMYMYMPMYSVHYCMYMFLNER